MGVVFSRSRFENVFVTPSSFMTAWRLRFIVLISGHLLALKASTAPLATFLLQSTYL